MIGEMRRVSELRHVSELRVLLHRHVRDAIEHREQCKVECCPATRVVALLVEVYAFRLAIVERRVTS